MFLQVPVIECCLSLEVYIDISTAYTHFSSSNLWGVFKWTILDPVSMIKAWPDSELPAIYLIVMCKMFRVEISPKGREESSSRSMA
jgi:hypothetical protein